jgi:hypothetical protein
MDDFYQIKGGDYRPVATHISLEEKDPKLHAILAYLESLGLKKYFQYEVTNEQSPTAIRIRLGWDPTPAQIKKAKYFRLRASVIHSVGHLLRIDENNMPHIAAHREEERSGDGVALVKQAHVVTAEFVEAFQKAGLKGLQTREIQWYRELPSQTRFVRFERVEPVKPFQGRRWLTSHVVMPPCLTPRRYTSGPLIGHLLGPEEAPHYELAWDLGGLAPPIFRFNRLAVEAMGDFDLAITREKSRPVWLHDQNAYREPYVPDERWEPEIIVSQRFREWIKKSGLPGCRKLDFDLVELVDAG